MVGLVHDTDHITTQAFKSEGDVIILVGETKAEFGGSELQYVMNGAASGRPPVIDLANEKKVLDALLGAIQQGLVASAHDLSEGGIAVALAESCISGGIGASAALTSELRPDHLLFSESQSRVLLSSKPEKAVALQAWLSEQGVVNAVIGEVKGSGLSINVNGKSGINAPVKQLEKVWKDAIPCLMK